MLQGSQPVSNRDELPTSIKSASELDSVAKNAESLPGNSSVIGWLRSDYNSDDKRDPNAPLFMLGSNDPSEVWGVKYLPLSGNSPVIPDRWIPVSERIPGSQEWVIVFAKWANQQVLCWDDVQNRWTDFEDQSYYADMFSHWMPLPAAPQQEVKNG